MIADDYKGFGIALANAVIPPHTALRWGQEYRELEACRKVDPYNPVAVPEEPETKALLETISFALIDLGLEIFGPDLGLYNRRFLVKDEQSSTHAVPLHQDTAYHRGWMNKASFFVALTESSAVNGGLTVWPGTWVYGSLGDAGVINRELLRGRRSFTPHMVPGDVLVMHSATWHESAPSTTGGLRILADIILQPSSDPSTIETLFGGEHARFAPENPFSSCRVSRLKELQAKVDEYEARA